MNKGGNHGNRFGAGRPRNEFRGSLLGTVAKNDKYWKDVLAGKPVILVPPKEGSTEPTFRYPTHHERERAREQCLRYGLGTQDEVVVLGSADVFEALAELLPDHLDDADLIDRILADLESRLNGETQ